MKPALLLQQESVMLFKLPPTSKSNPVVTGKSLAHRKMPAFQRAFFVSDVLAGEVEFKPTIGQLARDARVSLPCVRAARQIRHDPNLRFDVLTGSCNLLTAAARYRKNGKGKKGEAPVMTAATWMKADAETRRQFISSLGIASVWDVVELLTR